MEHYFPILGWGRSYTRDNLVSDLVAAAIVTIMLVPQSLAYALLAGLPAEVGLYASMLPLVAYAIFGTSRTLAVGPVAVVSLMTAAALGKLGLAGAAEYAAAAVTLAALSGVDAFGAWHFPLGLSCQFSVASCYCRLYNGIWHFDCGRANQTHPRNQGRWRKSD